MDAVPQIPGDTARFKVWIILAEKHTEKQAVKPTEQAKRKNGGNRFNSQALSRRSKRLPRQRHPAFEKAVVYSVQQQSLRKVPPNGC